jgi:hypothetical protein
MDVSSATKQLSSIPDGSLMHVVLGGHGGGWYMRWGSDRDKGALCATRSADAFLRALSRKMHSHASIFLDSCMSATKDDERKVFNPLPEYLAAKVNLAEYVAAKVGKGVRVIGSIYSFSDNKMKIANYHAWHASIELDKGKSNSTYLASGGSCPHWAASRTPDRDGNCKCPAGKKCNSISIGTAIPLLQQYRFFSKSDSCPRSLGQTSDTYFLPQCASSWSSVKCKCV